MNVYVTVDTQRAKLVCSMLLDAGLPFEVNTAAKQGDDRMFTVETGAVHQHALAAVHKAVMRRTNNT